MRKGTKRRGCFRVRDRSQLVDYVCRCERAAGGTRPLSRLCGVPASRLSDYKKGRRSDMAHDTFWSLARACCLVDLPDDEALALFIQVLLSVEHPAPANYPRSQAEERARHKREDKVLERRETERRMFQRFGDRTPLLEEIIGAAPARQLENGVVPGAKSPAWGNWPVGVAVMLKQSQFEVLRRAHPRAFQWAIDDDKRDAWIDSTDQGRLICVTFFERREFPPSRAGTTRR
jgi:hypothetical protein